MSTLTTTISILTDGYLLHAVLTNNGTNDIPTDIFMYENDGVAFGTYQGVCTLSEYTRLQTYTGTSIPVFGNKFVKYNQGNVYIPLGTDPTLIKAKLVNDVKTFKISFLSNNFSTDVITI